MLIEKKLFRVALGDLQVHSKVLKILQYLLEDLSSRKLQDCTRHSVIVCFYPLCIHVSQFLTNDGILEREAYLGKVSSFKLLMQSTKYGNANLDRYLGSVTVNIRRPIRQNLLEWTERHGIKPHLFIA